MNSVGDAIEDDPASPRILHVDDEEGLVDLAATFLEREGLSVTTATDAETGLSLLAEGPFDAVVSDYDMPGTDGLEFLAAVREEYPDLPFILFTGKGSEEIASEAISRGVTDYLQKETGTDQYAVLANRIEESVRRYRAENDLAEARRRYETLLANLPGMAYRCRISEGWPMEFVSEGCRELTGYDPEELISGEVDWEADVLVPEDREQTRSAVERAMDEGEPFEVTYRIIRNDGERRTLWEQGRAIEADAVADEDDPMLEGFITDVTERERNEQALRTVSATQRAVLQRVSDGVVLIDPDDANIAEIVEINAAAADLTEYEPSTLLDVDPADLLALSDATLDELASQDSFDRRLTLASPDGSPIDLDVSGCSLTFEGHRRLVLVLSSPE
ncbi:response regulator [Salinarchaeum laminariae]|uniref:response regulator n=1 Tax=Salinarchaeum laminariae TaxID=869888 RepID=UPI0020BE2242|nr:response regulator [Salinarchaeum laminariae]